MYLTTKIKYVSFFVEQFHYKKKLLTNFRKNLKFFSQEREQRILQKKAIFLLFSCFLIK